MQLGQSGSQSVSATRSSAVYRLQVPWTHPARRGPAVGLCERWWLDGLHVSAARLTHRVRAAVRHRSGHRGTLR